MTWAQHTDRDAIVDHPVRRAPTVGSAPPRRAGDLRIGDRVRCSAGYLTVTSAIVGDAVLRHVATSNAWRREAGSDIIDSADGVTSFSSHAL